MAAKRKTSPQATAPEVHNEPETALDITLLPPELPPTERLTTQPRNPQMPATPIMEKTMKTAEDFLAFGQSNIDAFVKSSQIWAAGVQDLSKQVAATAQANFDESMASFQALAAVKTPKDALDMQAALARTSLEKAVAETGKITDASLKLAEQVFAPITAQLNAVAGKFAKVA